MTYQRMISIKWLIKGQKLIKLRKERVLIANDSAALIKWCFELPAGFINSGNKLAMNN